MLSRDNHGLLKDLLAMTADTPTPPETTTTVAPFMRVIKTYVLRAGRMGSGQVRAFEQFGPQFLVPYTPERLD
ncbi:MAG: tRNA ((46)-N7)-methyltransferase TrmB, partial [Pseudomonadota bacterium]